MFSYWLQAVERVGCSVNFQIFLTSSTALKQTVWMESLSLKCGMFMNETWTPAPIITLKVSKNSRGLLSLSKLFNEKNWKEYNMSTNIYFIFKIFFQKKSPPRTRMLCIWTVRVPWGRGICVYFIIISEISLKMKTYEVLTDNKLLYLPMALVSFSPIDYKP